MLPLQEATWSSTLELVLHLTNVSSRDNLHNLTCEAENQAGPGEGVVQLDIECEWNTDAERPGNAGVAQHESPAVMEVTQELTGGFSGPGGVKSQRKET